MTAGERQGGSEVDGNMRNLSDRRKSCQSNLGEGKTASRDRRAIIRTSVERGSSFCNLVLKTDPLSVLAPSCRARHLGPTYGVQYSGTVTGEHRKNNTVTAKSFLGDPATGNSER